MVADGDPEDPIADDDREEPVADEDREGPVADDDRKNLIALIEDLDAISLASAVGGLLLVSKNLHHTHRFEALANMIAAGKAHGDRKVTATVLRRIHEALGKWTGMNDDPWPNLAVETFVYHGGTHLFIPGGIDTIFVLRALARAAGSVSDPQSA